MVVRPRMGGVVWAVGKIGMGGKGGGGGAGRWRDHSVSEASLEPTRYGRVDDGDVNLREVVVKIAMPSGPRREETPNRSY